MLRYERKYRITGSSYERILHELMSNPAGFDYSFPDRRINSVYLDDPNFTALNENMFGISNRVKYRLRYYGEEIDQIRNPILEKKIKANMLGTKAYEKVDLIENECFDLKRINELKMLREENLFPVVLVRYLRTYLESFDHKIRATIDRELSYYAYQNEDLLPIRHADSALIVEIKYEATVEDEIDYCLQSIPYRLTKNSKFVSAMQAFWM